MTSYANMSTFASALQGLSVSGKVVGEKGAVMEASSGKRALDFNITVNQSSTLPEIAQFIEAVLAGGSKDDISDLVIAIINKRHPRNGEGCKNTGMESLLYLYENGYPELVIQIMEFIPEFGCIKDYWRMIAIINKRLTGAVSISYFTKYNPLIQEIFEYYWMYVDKDMNTFQDWNVKYEGLSPEEKQEKIPELKAHLSNAGKWGPREKGSEDANIHWFIPIFNRETDEMTEFKKQSLRNMLVRFKFQSYLDKEGNHIKIYTDSVFPSLKSTHQKSTRKIMSHLSKLCDVAEQKTCSGRWSELDPKTTPSGFLAKQRKAWLNEKNKVVMTPYEKETGNRYPDVEDRVIARNILLASLDKVKGGVLAPYQLIQKIKQGVSDSEEAVIEAQWKSLVENTKKDIKSYMMEIRVKAAEEAGTPVEEVVEVVDNDIENVLAMIDVSPSMDDKAGEGFSCMDLSISLGIVASELNTGPFKHMALSYSDIPHLFHFVHADGREFSLSEKYHTIMSSMGYDTDVGRAMDLILKVAKENNIPEDELPTLLILSDGQFDVQILKIYNNSYSDENPDEKWNTTFEIFHKKFVMSGYSAPPQINFWNLNARCLDPRTYGFQAQADKKGVSMLSGFNTSSFKMIMSGQEIVTLTGAAKEEADKKSAWDDFRGMIDQDCYVWVKELMSVSGEGVLTDYSFELGEVDEKRQPRTLASLRGIEEDEVEGFEVVEECEVSGGASAP